MQACTSTPALLGIKHARSAAIPGPWRYVACFFRGQKLGALPSFAGLHVSRKLEKPGPTTPMGQLPLQQASLAVYPTVHARLHVPPCKPDGQRPAQLAIYSGFPCRTHNGRRVSVSAVKHF